MKQIKLRKTNHLIHAFLFCFTAMIWVIPWVLITNANNRHNAMLIAQGLVETEVKKPWSKFNVVSAWLSTITISFAVYVVGGGKTEVFAIVTAILIAVSCAVTFEFLMKRRTF